PGQVEIPAFDHLHAEGWNIMVVHKEGGHHNALLGVDVWVEGPACGVILVIAKRGQIVAYSNIGDAAQREQVFPECLGAFPAERPRVVDHQHLITVEADFLITDEIQLAVNDEGANDKPDGNNELKDDEAAA